MSFGFDRVGLPIATMPKLMSPGRPPTYRARSCLCIAREITYCLTARSSSNAPTRFCSLGDRRSSMSSMTCSSTLSGDVHTCTASGASSIDGNNLYLGLVSDYRKARNAWSQIESPRSRRTGIDDESSLGPGNKLSVRVTVDDHIVRV